MSPHFSALPDALALDLHTSAAEPTNDRRLHEHLDRLRCGMIFCDAEGRVHWLNRSAKRLLACGPLRLVGSCLAGDSEAQTDELMNALAGCAVGNTASYLRLGQGTCALHLAIQACAHSTTMVLTLTSPGRSADIPANALIQLFGLTPTKVDLLPYPELPREKQPPPKCGMATTDSRGLVWCRSVDVPRRSATHERLAACR